METNRKLRDHILRTLRRQGPLRARDIEDISAESWQSSGWTAERNVDRMLSMLWVMGKILIAGREGIERVWDLTTRWLPEWAPTGVMTEKQVVETAAQHSLRALGVATPQHIKEHFIRGGYPGLPEALGRLEKKQLVRRALVTGADGKPLPGKWYLHADDLALTKKLDPSATPRTTLLSPFDNLICDRKRTELLWDFHYRIEIYVPKAQRKYGYYSLPILHRDRLIGRIDPKADRKRGVLVINSLHFEPKVSADRETGAAVSGAIRELADFVAGGNVELASAVVPRPWRAVVKV
jgi:uncharacterized protein YcaQ